MTHTGTREDAIASLRLAGRIAHMFTGAIQVQAFDTIGAIEAHASRVNDTRLIRHINRYVKFFASH